MNNNEAWFNQHSMAPGTAWKHRQIRLHGLSGTPRNHTPRQLAEEPQYKLDDLYISPMRQRRRNSNDGEVSYEPVELNMQPTGIRIFDAYVVFLSEGGSNLTAFAKRHGLRREDIDSMVFILTGMRGVDFRMAFQVRMADELLRYTDLEIPDVARRSGFGSANNLYLTYKREFNLAPGRRRQAIRKQGDLGRYKP